jgi:osmotically inducible protein OsmC
VTRAGSRAQRVPGISAPKFDEIAAKAKAGCPVPRLLNAKVALTAKLA